MGEIHGPYYDQIYRKGNNMEETFDPSKEGRRIVTRFGQPNDRQVTEDRQRQEESAPRKDGQDVSKKESGR